MNKRTGLTPGVPDRKSKWIKVGSDWYESPYGVVQRGEVFGGWYAWRAGVRTGHPLGRYGTMREAQEALVRATEEQLVTHADIVPQQDMEYTKTRDAALALMRECWRDATDTVISGLSEVVPLYTINAIATVASELFQARWECHLRR